MESVEYLVWGWEGHKKEETVQYIQLPTRDRKRDLLFV